MKRWRLYSALAATFVFTTAILTSLILPGVGTKTTVLIGFDHLLPLAVVASYPTSAAPTRDAPAHLTRSSDIPGMSMKRTKYAQVLHTLPPSAAALASDRMNC